jgi:hypothetical protein
LPSFWRFLLKLGSLLLPQRRGSFFVETDAPNRN